MDKEKKKLQRICVYAASSSQAGADYIHAAQQVGSLLASENITTVYGGGSIGLMGALADAVLAGNGKLVGIIPEFMMKLEWGNPNVSQMIITENMAERKLLLMKEADAIIVLPGGTGTLEEVSEALSRKKLGLLDCPLILLNTNGFFDSLVSFLERMIEDKFIRPEHRKLWSVAQDTSEILTLIRKAESLGNSAHELAAM
jgi:uncharacterized protein (TIGR00730 family)